MSTPYRTPKAIYDVVKTLFLIDVQGVGRRYANLVLKKADIDMSKRAGELSDDEVW